MRFADDSPMPFGKFKGKPLKDVPASYLIWLHGEMLDNDDKVALFRYLEANKTALEQEVESGGES